MRTRPDKRLSFMRPTLPRLDTRIALPTPRPAGGRGFKPTIAFYGTIEWKNLIRGIIRERGRMCQNPKCTTPDRARGKRIYGDHTVELKDGGDALNPSNIMLLCASCHGKKTAQAKYVREGG